MSTDAAAVPSPQCARCGAAYRRSNFQRPCLCPACGRSLETAAPRTRSRLSPIWTYGLVAIGLGVGVTALAARNFTQRSAVAAASRAPFERRVSLSEWPADFNQLVAEKIRFLERELSRAPDDPVLLSALGDAHTYRALAARDAEDGQERMRASLEQVRTCISKLDLPAPLAAEQLRRRLDVFDQLLFVDRPAGSATARAWRLGVGRELFPRESGGSIPVAGASSAGVAVGAGRPMGAASSTGAPMGAPGVAVGPPPGNGSPPEPLTPASPPGNSESADSDRAADRSPGPEVSAGGSGGGQMATASGVAARLLPQGGSRSTEVISRYRPGMVDPMAPISPQIARLRGLLRKSPGNPALSDQLGYLLMARGSHFVPSRPRDENQLAGRNDLREAARVYRLAAEKCALAVERAAFLDAAADVHRQLEEWDSQYRLLLAATRCLPMSDALWRKLERAALRQGEMEVCRTARRNAEKWAFPAIDVAMVPPPAAR